MRRLGWAFLLLLVSCSRCGSSGPTAAVRADVAFSGFHPGCLRVTATDSTLSSRTASVDLEIPGTDLSGTRRIAVFAGTDWSTRLTVTAEALEQSCAGPVVARQSQDVRLPAQGIDPELFTLSAVDGDHDGYVSASQALPGSDCDDGDPQIHPGALERCNGVDDDCDGTGDGPVTTLYPDLDGDGHGAGSGISACGTAAGLVAANDDCDDDPDGGAAIHPGAPEACNGLDDDCNGAIDDGLSLVDFWRDSDQDGFGAADAGVRACAQPAGTVTNSADCNDSSSYVHPKAAEEFCDGIDDDCSGAVDDGPYDVGTPCSAGGCPGVKVCAAGPNATSTVCTGGPSQWYFDKDHDGHGGADAGLACVGDGGIVRTQDDCDDLDPFTYDGGAEICDQKDNDCNGSVDESSQCATAHWGAPSGVPAGGGNVWNTVGEAPFSGGPAVWIAGNGGLAAVRYPGVAFNQWTKVCSDPLGFNFKSVWVDPNQGVDTAYLGGGTGTNTGGGIQSHQILELGLCDTIATGGADVVGVVGFGVGPEVYGVSVKGETYKWTVANGVLTGLDAGTAGTKNVIGGTKIVLKDLHGLAPNDLYAVGFSTGPQLSRIFHFDGNSWTEMDLSALTAKAEQLNAVWELSPSAVYVVGTTGTVLFFDGTAWSDTAIPAVPFGPTLTAVRVLAPSAVYATTASGQVLRFNGKSWELLAPGNGSALNDLAALRPDELWTVGNNNTVLHWFE